MKELINFRNVKKTYTIGEKSFDALNGASFSINKGEFVVILGPSGAGKSTILNLLGGMDKATSGEIIIDGKDISKLSSKELTKYRAENIGFIFQFYNILPTLTVQENVELINDIVKNPKPTTMTVIILDVIWIWNDYLLPSLTLKSTANRTIPISTAKFFGQYTISWNEAMAALVVTIIPVVIFYLVCQKYIVEGVAAGAVKG